MSFNFKKNQIVRLVGQITTIEPYSTTLPAADPKYVVNYETRQKVDAYFKLGQMPIIMDGATEPSLQPYITSTSLCARLRHACADKVIQTRAAMGEEHRLNLMQIYSLKVGQVDDAISNEKKKADADSGETKSEGKAIDLAREREYRLSHPVESTFGLFDLIGCLGVSHAIPTRPVEMAYLGGVRHDLNKQFVLDNLNQEGRVQYEDRREFNTNKSLLQEELKVLEKEFKAEYKKCPKEGGKTVLNETATALKAQMDAKEAEIAALKKDLGGMSISTQLPIPARHIVPAGYSFKHSITIGDVSTTTASSMVIYGLERLSLYPKMGAYKKSGGELAFEYEVFVCSEEHAEPKSLGKIKLGGFKPVDTSGLTAEGQDWWQAAKADEAWHVLG